MYRRILIPLDGSTLAEQVLPWAKMLAVRSKATIVLIQAIPHLHGPLRVDGEVIQVDEQTEMLQMRAHEYLEEVCKELGNAHIPAASEVRVGAPAPAILEFAEGSGIDLIAMTTHGSTGVLDWVYGSVADKVLHGAHVPVLLVRASDPPAASGPLKRILVALDGSELAERALEPARQLAVDFDAELSLLRVWERPLYGIEDSPSVMEALERSSREGAEHYITVAAQRLRAQGARVRGATTSGPVAPGILEQAQTLAADLIVMTTHGRSGLGRWVMGSVADGVLRAAMVPVLLIHAAHAA